MPNPLSILIVDDELNIRKTLALAVESEGHTVVAVSSPQDALDQASRTKFDMAFIDVRLGAENGIELIAPLLAGSPWLKVVVITAHASIDTAIEAMRRGAIDYLPKPFNPVQVFAMTRKVGEMRQLEERVQSLESELRRGAVNTELKSHSAAMQRAVELAREVAPTDATVLIVGENGTGKGVIAKAIHQWSTRTSAPFGVVSCPSLSAELLESELFGHVKGAFTGAVRDNQGRIAACEGGTLFLDEIGDLPLPVQPKLLRFLQDREYERVGDQRTRRADVRVIAATNVDLKAAVKMGRFREDLLYRLNVIRIELPPLRQRQADIVLLAERFLASLRHDKKILGFSEEAVDQLLQHHWPGNIRELRNVVERAVILCHGQWIEPKHLSFDETPAMPTGKQVGDLVSLEELEEAHIRRVVAATRSLDEAARVLGIDAATLWRRRKKYGL
jgi:NtrC-family two-component system response regulator AlgB